MIDLKECDAIAEALTEAFLTAEAINWPVAWQFAYRLSKKLGIQIHIVLTAGERTRFVVMPMTIVALIMISGCVPTSWDGLRQQLAADITSERIVNGCPGRVTPENMPCVEASERAVLMALDPLALPRYEQFAYERRNCRVNCAEVGRSWRVAWDQMHSNLAGGEPFFYTQGAP